MVLMPTLERQRVGFLGQKAAVRLQETQVSCPAGAGGAVRAGPPPHGPWHGGQSASAWAAEFLQHLGQQRQQWSAMDLAWLLILKNVRTAHTSATLAPRCAASI